MIAGATRLVALALSGLTPIVALAEDATPSFKGKTVTIVVGTSSGGGYDTYARLFQRYRGKHLPGEPAVVVANMPGAGSNIAAAYVARVAPKDGTYIAAPFAAQPLGPVLEDPTKFKYDPSSVHYLGTATSDVYLCMVRPDAPATTFDDVFKTSDIMGGTAESGSTGYLPIVLDNVLGAKFKVVFGYPGTREITMAMQKGEIHGMCGMNWSSINSQYADLLKTGAVKIIAQEHEKGHPEMNAMGVPLTFARAQNDVQRRVLEIIYSQEVFARPYFVAAETPSETLKLLRAAFMETWRDPDLLAEARKMNLDVDPTSGEESTRVRQTYWRKPGTPSSFGADRRGETAPLGKHCRRRCSKFVTWSTKVWPNAPIAQQLGSLLKFNRCQIAW